jgi:acetolactate synthase-1/2/3 large subunit
MKLSDYVFEFLRKRGIGTVFYLPGGGCMHLLDSLGANTSINAVSLLHEQAVAIACESYANTTENPGAALVTTGPGGTNAVTGVWAAYIDSVPCFFLSGQVKTADLKSRFGVRTHGSQEADIISIVSSITKYSVMITVKDSIRYHLERAWHEMLTGRRGPVWVDIPLDIQGALIEPKALKEFEPTDESIESVDVTCIIDAINKARRPVIIAGNGLSKCKDKFFGLLDFLRIPVIPTWKAMDYIPNSHPFYAGRAGGMGDRHGNLAMQNSDLLISLGSRLDFSITGYDRSDWAVKAKKIVVDIDANEISKLEGAGNLIPVNADVSDVIEALLERKSEFKLPNISNWKDKIKEWQGKYPVNTEEKFTTPDGGITTYAFVDTLCRCLPEGAFVAPCSAGTTAEIFFQAFTVKPGQTIRSNHGLGAMGFEIPNAIGMCVANGGNTVVCIAGDGGMQLNIQELAVIKGRNLPIKLFVINNRGYASIRNMQNTHFNKRYVGCNVDSGLFLPETCGLASAYGFPYFRAEIPEQLDEVVKTALSTSGAVLCEIVVAGDCLVTPRTATQVMPDGSMRSSPLENQFPFLGDEEASKNKS